MFRPRRAGLVLALLVSAACALIALDLHEDGGAPLRRAGQAIAGPVEGLVADLTAPFTAAADRRVQELERQNTGLQARLWAVNADRELALAARNLASDGASVRVPAHAGRRLVTARVVALGSRPGHAATATIDVGLRDGVGPDLTVLNTDGLVGRVLDAGPHTATVLLAADPTSQIGVRLAESGEIGVLTGGGRDAPFRLELLDGDAPVKAGQTVETLGSDRTRPYVSDVPLGTVVSAGPPGSGVTRSALVRPAVDFTSLGVVGVVLPPKDPS